LEEEVAVRQILAQGVDLVHHAIHLEAVVVDAKTAYLKAQNCSSS
jgi:hypothetical protein